MSIRTDLEQSIRDSYRLIREYEEIIHLSDRPTERLRSQREIEQQWRLIEEYLDEYLPLAEDGIPEDVDRTVRQARSWQKDLDELVASATVAHRPQSVPTSGTVLYVPEGFSVVMIPPGKSLQDMLESRPTPKLPQIPAGVVEIWVGKESIWSQSRPAGQGVGFLVSERGFVISARRITEKSEQVYVRLSGEERILPASVVAQSPDTFLALLQVPPGPAYPHLRLAQAEASFPLGDTVTLVDPRHGRTEGTVTGIHASVKLALSEDQSIIVTGGLVVEPSLSRGGQGGAAVLNAQGEAVGALIAGSDRASILVSSSRIREEFSKYLIGGQ